MSIGKYAEADHAELCALWDLVFSDDPPRNRPALVIERKLTQQRGLLLVTTLGSALVGTVLAGHDGVRGSKPTTGPRP
jgi:hypothetical protein